MKVSIIHRLAVFSRHVLPQPESHGGDPNKDYDRLLRALATKQAEWDPAWNDCLQKGLTDFCCMQSQSNVNMVFTFASARVLLSRTNATLPHLTVHTRTYRTTQSKMLPTSLTSTYREYKKDTDSIAAWLASTAKAAGYTMDTAVSGSPKPPDGRLKGKARKEAKKQASTPAQNVPKYIISISDFTKLASFIAEKGIPVPVSFNTALDRVILAHSEFGRSYANTRKNSMELQKASMRTLLMVSVAYPQCATSECQSPGEIDVANNYNTVLRAVRETLASFVPAGEEIDVDSVPATEGSSNRFANLEVYEPSQEFLDAPPIERPQPIRGDKSTYETKTTSALQDAVFALTALINDMNRMRSVIESIWRRYRLGEVDVAAAAIATNPGVEMIRNMMTEILPLIEKFGGLDHVMLVTYKLHCLAAGFTKEAVMATATKPAADFNYKTYDVGNRTFFLVFRAVNSFLDVLAPGQVPLYQEGMFGYYNPATDHRSKTDEQKLRYDGALLMGSLSDLSTALYIKDWPIFDEFLRGIQQMNQTNSSILLRQRENSECSHRDESLCTFSNLRDSISWLSVIQYRVFFFVDENQANGNACSR